MQREGLSSCTPRDQCTMNGRRLRQQEPSIRASLVEGPTTRGNRKRLQPHHARKAWGASRAPRNPSGVKGGLRHFGQRAPYHFRVFGAFGSSKMSSQAPMIYSATSGLCGLFERAGHVSEALGRFRSALWQYPSGLGFLRQRPAGKARSMALRVQSTQI